jgi:hypothetical protein
VTDPQKRLRQLVVPWLCLLGVLLCYELPAALRSTRFEPGRLSLSLELPLLLTLWLALPERPLSRRLFALCGWLLGVYRFDQWVCWTLMQEDPPLYDQWFMLRHLWVLLSDLMSFKTAAILGSIVLGIVLLSLLVRALLRRARVLVTPERRRSTGRVGLLLWAALLVAQLASATSPDPKVTWLTPGLARNIATSRATYREVQGRIQSSPYNAYAQLRLDHKPDVLLFLVESYGRLLWHEPRMSTRHLALLRALEAQLADAGWHAVSAFATARVSGGRSWIAEGGILLGTPIRYEAVFQHLVAQQPMSLVRFLNLNGYHSVLLAPADRHRRGAHPVNRYQFSQLISFDDFDYRGRHVGWGMVPDQFSMAFVDAHVLQKARQPLFLDFHMVSSHAPWAELPVFVERPERLLGAESAEAQPKLGRGSLVTPFRRYERGSDRFAYEGPLNAEMGERYRACVEYSLRTIVQYLRGRSRDALVVALGDHQPPVIARENRSYDTPVHVFARDPARLAPLLAHGFRPGLGIPAESAPAMLHAGLFSTLVRSLLAPGCGGCALPPFLPQGQQLLTP